MAITESSRSITKEITLLAPVDRVWKALTDAEELTRWFPLDARVTPGVGGSIWMSWRDEYQFETPISDWSPNRGLRLIYMDASPKTGSSGVPSLKVPHQIAVEYHLSGSGGETSLRLVHSGFSAEASWDAQFDATISGWEFQLQNLKLYLERHYGTPRRCIVARADLGRSVVDAAWDSAMGPTGFLRTEHPAPSEVGRRFAITTADGDHLEGVVHTLVRPRDFTAWVTNLNDAWLRFHIDDLPLFGRRHANLLVSTYGVPQARVAELQAHFTALFDRIFTPEHRHERPTF